MKRKSMREFIRENREELDRAINSAIGSCEGQHSRLNDSDRRDWIMNDEGLYNWARSEGVRV